MAKVKKGTAKEYECSLTKPVEEDFSQDEIDALAAEAGCKDGEYDAELVVSDDGKEHTYTVRPKSAEDIAAGAVKEPEPPLYGTVIGATEGLAPTGPMQGEPGAQDQDWKSGADKAPEWKPVEGKHKK